MDMRSREQISKNMKAVKSSGSYIERLLGKELWRLGYRYRKNDRSVFGNPDFTFKRYKIAIFVDSEFWHGKDWSKRKGDHKTNIKFWHRKIERNIARDLEVNERLEVDGWTVLRFWGKDIREDLENCVKKVISKIDLARNGIH